MSNTVIRPVGYTGSVQQLIWDYGSGANVSAYLWGGGGGGGGDDSLRGGYGGGGGYTKVDFTLDDGDIIELAVGGGGAGGINSGRSFNPVLSPGGAAGASWVLDQVFNTRTAVGSVSVVPYSNGAYCNFLNTYGVWINPISARYFDNTYTVNFPISGYYTIIASCDNYGYVYIDGVEVLAVPDFHYTVQTTVYVTAGNHTVRLYGVNTGGPGSFGATIAGGDGYSGGNGSAAGPGGSSGSGGGGGGATILRLNSSVIAVAGGGGGGGGGGKSSAGQNAPGSRGQDPASNAGQTGQTKTGDGGGAGGGGGGATGGQGGNVGGGDVGGNAGVYGTSSGDSTANPTNRNPGGTNSPYYTSGVGQGGVNTRPGTNGYAVLVFNIPGLFVHHDGNYTPVSKTWVKDNGIWRQAQSIWTKYGGTWREVLGGTPPGFTSISGNFGVNSRPYS